MRDRRTLESQLEEDPTIAELMAQLEEHETTWGAGLPFGGSPGAKMPEDNDASD